MKGMPMAVPLLWAIDDADAHPAVPRMHRCGPT